MVHCGSIRQTATILTMNKDCLRTGDKATVHFRFIKTPEYLHCDQKLVFREGRTKAVGTITKLLQVGNTQAAKAQQAKMQANKKASKEGAANDEAGSAARPASPNTAQLPAEEENLCNNDDREQAEVWQWRTAERRSETQRERPEHAQHLHRRVCRRSLRLKPPPETSAWNLCLEPSPSSIPSASGREVIIAPLGGCTETPTDLVPSNENLKL
ncbi:hypothetical protein LDENG_00264790 [Lucifuga dentata]|nr:hypothetical protein LDENG_00264790 [Lucifuga dentata]